MIEIQEDLKTGRKKDRKIRKKGKQEDIITGRRKTERQEDRKTKKNRHTSIYLESDIFGVIS